MNRLTGPRVDYEQYGRGYASRRRADPRIAARVHATLGDARTVVNVGAGPWSLRPPATTVGWTARAGIRR